jgi:hypothetical protein
MPQDKTHSEAILAACERLRKLADAYEKMEPDWLDRAIKDQVRLGLVNLRRYIEDPEYDRITPDSPFVELTYPVEWDFTPRENQPHGRWLSGTFTAADVVDGKIPDEKVREVLHEHRQLEALSRITKGVVEWRKDGKTNANDPAAYILPQDLVDWLDETTGKSVTEKRRRLIDELAQPFEFKPPLTFTFTFTTDTGETLEGTVVALFYPLVVDTGERRAWFSLGVGLAFTNLGSLALSEKDMAKLLENLITKLDGETPRAETSERSTKATRSAPRAGPPTPRVATLLDQTTRLDAKAAKALGFLSGTLWPRKLEKIRKWSELYQDEVERIRTEHGDAAFETAAGIRGPLLSRMWDKDGRELVELATEAKENLLDRVGPRGFRRVIKNEDGLKTEYLVKRWRAGSGYMQVRFSWYGQAWPMVGDALKAEEDRLQTEKSRGPLLFDELNTEAQEGVNRGLAFLGTLEDARRVGDYLIRRFGAEGLNPVRIPARELRRLLQCENNEKGHRRVEGAIEALRRLDFGYDAAGVGREWSGKIRGYFVSSWSYEGRGPGKHTDGNFGMTLSEIALGCLRVFQVAADRIRDVPGAFRFDFTKKLDKDKQQELDYIRGFSTLVPYFDKAAGLTRHQEHLLRYLERELTVRKDGTTKGRRDLRAKPTAKDANEPRLYDASFCPLLKKGRHYAGSLGHHGNNAERGRRLKGTPQLRTKSGGARAGGLLDAMGYDLLPGRADAARTATVEAALKDLKAVVVEALGGVVGGKKDGQWLTLEDAAKLPVGELLEVSWFLFMAEDFRKRIRTKIERHHQSRYERGETDTLVRVTTDPSEYEKAQENAGGTVEPVGLSELRHLMRAARKDRGLSQKKLGQVFNVSQAVVANWERGPEHKGKAIPEYLRPLVLRWTETGEGLTEDELKALAARRPGVKKTGRL